MSLVGAPQRKRVHCGFCNSPKVITISMSGANGPGVTLLSCHRCQRRWWVDEDGTIPLKAALDRLRKPSTTG